MLAAEKPPLGEVYLEHYGVKGMKWGVRQKIDTYNNAKDASGVSRKDARVAKRSVSRKLSRDLEDFERTNDRDRDNEIIKSRRGMIDADRKYSDIKRDLKGRKGELGKNAVRVELAKARAERTAVAFKSEQFTSGEKVVNSLLNVVDDITGTPRRVYRQGH